MILGRRIQRPNGPHAHLEVVAMADTGPKRPNGPYAHLEVVAMADTWPKRPNGPHAHLEVVAMADTGRGTPDLETFRCELGEGDAVLV